jgi:DNA-binding HxlR family transcriptional regulator
MLSSTQEVFVTMNEDEYSHVIENGIANTENNTLDFTQIYEKVRDQSYRGVSKTTIRKRLTKMIEAEIIDKDDKPRVRNEVLYSLTPARIFERRFFDLGSKQELKRSTNEEQEADKEVCLLILLQAALGTELPKVVNGRVLGAPGRYNSTTKGYESIVSEKQHGVIMGEVLEHTNIGLGGLFKQVNFGQLLRKKDYIQILRNEFGLSDNTMKVVSRNGEIGIKISDEQLKEFITMCACLIFEVRFRIRETINIALLNALSKKVSLIDISTISFYSIFEQEAFKYYLSFYGREALNYEYHHVIEFLHRRNEESNNKQISKNAKRKEIREFIQNRKDQILQSDKSIIASYHGLIKCDKYVDAPGGLKDRYDKYCNYVRIDMPKEYRDLINILMGMIYPSFLRRYHTTYSKLVEFTKSLPCIDY